MFAIPPAAEKFLARLNRASVWHREVRVWGERLFVPSADRLLYAALHRAGLMGRAEREFFQNAIRPGMTVVDVGANIGLYSLLFAKLVGSQGRVYAFEPDTVLFEALSRARALVSLENLHPFPVALGDKAGTHRLRRSFFNSGDNRIEPSAHPGTTGAESPEITVARGDELLAVAPPVDFIKIDIQGWELHALRGLSATIERSPALEIFLEFWPQGLRAAGCEPGELFEFLERRGFSIQRERSGRWEPAGECASLEKEVSGHRYINLWARKLLSR